MSAIPQNRAHLLELIEGRFAKLWALIEPLSEDEGTILVDDFFSIKDIVILRSWWGERVVKWIVAGQQGKAMAFPAKGYTWRQTPALNRALAEEYEEVSLVAARKKLKGAKTKVIKAIGTLTDRELEELNVFDWTEKWPVMRWISVGTSSQYDGGARLIRKALKQNR